MVPTSLDRSQVDLSIVVPSFNEELRLPRTFPLLHRHMVGLGEPFEFVLVDDGSSDDTLAYLRQMAGRHSNVHVVALPHNRGKGRAVAEGVRMTAGKFVLVTDADLSAPIEELEKLRSALLSGADIACGSRAAPGARELDQPVHRRVMGRGFNWLVQATLLPGIKDTQCGFKLFRGWVARQLFAQLTTDGFAFDVELLWRARGGGYRIAEVPVRWRNSDSTRVSPIRHSVQMSSDLLRICLKRSKLPATTCLSQSRSQSQ